jgi:hypothetical protein
MRVKDVKKIVLAHAGSPDSGVTPRWLQTTYHHEVVTFTAGLDKGQELGPAHIAGADRRESDKRHRPRAPEALQRQRRPRLPRIAAQPVRHAGCSGR